MTVLTVFKSERPSLEVCKPAHPTRFVAFRAACRYGNDLTLTSGTVNEHDDLFN